MVAAAVNGAVVAVPVEGAVIVTDGAVDSELAHQLLDVHVLAHDRRRIVRGQQLLGERSDQGRIDPLVSLVGPQAVEVDRLIGQGSRRREGPDLLVEVAGAVVEVGPSEAAIDVLGEREQPDKLAVDDHSGVGRSRSSNPHLSQQVVADPLAEL